MEKMTRGEFVRLFPIGSKIRCDAFDSNGDEWVEVLCHGRARHFFCIYKCGVECLLEYNNNWEVYEEPKPEFNFVADEMWGKFNGGIIIKFVPLHQRDANLHTWLRINPYGNCKIVMEKEIRKQYVPCDRPQNFEDYSK